MNQAELSLEEHSIPDDKINGRDWIKYSISVWDDIKTAEERKYHHPALFPLELANKLIKIYSRTNEVILDPFAGIGSTLVSAASLNRAGIGFELNREYTTIAEDRLSLYDSNTHIFNETCLNLDNHIPENTVDFCLTSPPYWDILNRKRSADYKAIKNYSEKDDDLGNIKDYSDFLNQLSTVFQKVYRSLKCGKHCVVIVMDIRKKNKFYPFHMDICHMMQAIGFELEDFIIWDRRKEYNNLRPLGYPSVFRVNKVHEYICIFKKSTVSRKC